MKKFLAYYFIYRTTKDAMTAAKIYQMIYHPEKTTNMQIFEYVKPSVVETPRVSDKKQEIIASLNYLKNKAIKSKQDKESIYSLEMVLNNM
jgi:short-subunit dehydrogenase involved in D-alanine esterification of teichoic acids